MVTIGHLLMKKKFKMWNWTTDDDGRRPIAKRHLCDSGDSKKKNKPVNHEIIYEYFKISRIYILRWLDTPENIWWVGKELLLKYDFTKLRPVKILGEDKPVWLFFSIYWAYNAYQLLRT